MQPDAERSAEARAWLSKARLDFRAAQFEFSAQPPLTADIVFHSQQLAEKALKAFLAWHDQPFRKTHNLVEVGQQCTDIDSSIEQVVRRASILTEYAWRFRYPGDVDEPSVDEAENAFTIACELFDAILARLPDELQP